MMDIRYAFLHQRESWEGYRLNIQPGDKWEELVYHMEKRHGCHSTSKQSRTAVGFSKIVGWRWQAHVRGQEYWSLPYLPLNAECRPGERFVLARLPCVRGEMPHVPVRYRTQYVAPASHSQHQHYTPAPASPHVVSFSETMSEEDRLQLLIQAASGNNRRREVVRVEPGRSQHPPPGYVCHRCLRRGHWKQHCPTWHDPDFVAPKQYKAPTGIPRSFLRQPTTDAEKASALKLADGTLVVAEDNTRGVVMPMTKSAYAEDDVDEKWDTSEGDGFMDD